MSRLLFYPFCLLLATSAPAAEFDPRAFSSGSPAEASYVEALSAPPENRAEALRTVEELLQGESPSAPAFPPGALLYAAARLSEGERARSAWQELLRAGPDGPFYPDALDGLASSAEAERRWDEAATHLKILSETLDGERERGEALGRLLDALDRSGKAAEARALAVTLWTRHAHLPAAAKAGAYLSRGGDPSAGLTARELYLRGKTLLDGGSREAAVEALSLLQNRLRPKDGLRADAALALGKALHYLRRYKESLPPLEEAARKAKAAETAQEARFWRARSLFGLDRGDEGAKDLVAAAGKWPGSPKAPQWLLQAYRVFQGRSMTREAEDARKRLFAKYSSSDEAVEVRWTEAWTLYKAGRHAEAAQGFEKAVRGAAKGWNRAGGLYWASAAYRKAGQTEAAEKVRGQLLAEYPAGYYARLARNDAAGLPPTAGLSDPRGRGDAPLRLFLPAAGDLPASGALGRAAAYLRLGLREAAKRILDRAGSQSSEALRLRYWAEDFHGVLETAGCEWTAWPWPGEPGPGGDACRVSYAPAFPASVTAAARESGVHPHLLLAVARTESQFDAEAYSPWEARGLMQFIPATARLTAGDLGVAGFSEDMLFDPATAFRLGARHLRELLDRFDGNVPSAVAAYNAGAAAVASWRDKGPGLGEAEFVEGIPYRETRKYVKKVLTYLDVYGLLDSPGLWKAESPLP